MRRHGDLFMKIVSIENLMAAYLKARRGKRWQRQVKNFEGNTERNLATIRDALINKSFTTSAYKTKTIHEPKKRLIFKLPFAPDRIVHHALMNVIEPIWSGLFIFDSYACRPGKGIHAGSARTMQYLRRNKYCLKGDMSKFYPSISHDILYKIVERKIKCKDTLWLLKDIIYSIAGDRNVPIGNYTSQWFGNLYLNEMDSYLKGEFKVKDYIRYCDDFIVFHDDKSLLGEIKSKLEEFLDSRLRLRMSRCEIFPVDIGVDFLGYRHFRNYILLRKSTAKRIMRRLKKLPGLLLMGKITQEQFRSSLASIEGWLKWANTHNLSLKLRINDLREDYLGI